VKKELNETQKESLINEKLKVISIRRVEKGEDGGPKKPDLSAGGWTENPGSGPQGLGMDLRVTWPTGLPRTHWKS